MPAVLIPFGPPQWGIDGLTLADVGRIELDQGEVVVLAQASGLVSPAACIVSQEL